MSFAREVALHPDLIQDVVEELLEADIISPNEIKKLKNEKATPKYDPIMLMEIRHEQVKIRSSVTPKENRLDEYRISEKTAQKVEIDYIKVNKEIEKFKKELELERKRLIALNKISNERSHVTNNKQNTIKQQPVPVINVITQLKNKDSGYNEKPALINGKQKCSPGIKNEMIEKPIEVNGHKPLCMTTQLNRKRCLNEESSACPHRVFKIEERDNDSSEYKNNVVEDKNNVVITKKKTNKKQSINDEMENKSDKKQKNNFLASKTINKWKLFVMRQQTSRCSKHEQLIWIQQRKYLLKKYWAKWVNYYQNKKQMRNEIIKKKIRMEKLNLFFEKLEEAKNKLITGKESVLKIIDKQDSNFEQPTKKNEKLTGDRNSVFVNRLKAQKNIIKEQKEKLEEQTKLIQQLKEDKLKDSIKEFNKNLYFNIRETVKNCDNKLKPKAKLLANKLNIYNENAEKLKEDYFIIRMNERAQERKEKWEMIRIRKQLIEEEKILKQAEEEERKKEEEEKERRKKIQEKKEQIRLKKENELKKIKEIEDMKRKTEMAKDYFQNYLKRRIIKMLKINVELQKKCELQSKIYYEHKLLKKILVRWRAEYSALVEQKLHMAEMFYKSKLLHTCWTRWILFYSESIQKQQVADDFNDAKLLEKTFYAWRKFTDEECTETKKKTEDATNYYCRKLTHKCYMRWKLFPDITRSIREEEKRIRSWREKVLEIIPDFNPHLIYDDEEDV